MKLIHALFFALPSLAQAYADPVFLQKSALDIATVLAPVPAQGSAVDLKDFETLLSYQSTRTAFECARAARVVDVRLETLFGPEDGPLTTDEVKRWSAFFERVRLDTDFFVQETKIKWGRLRPYLSDSRVNPCIHREVTKAYPSGHAAIGRVFALVLKDLDSKRAEQFQMRGEQIAEDRVRAGVHHASDIQAGKHLGDEVYKKLLSNPQFLKELQALKR